MNRMIRAALAIAGLGLALAGCSAAISPKTIVDRAIEARSAGDIAEDNRIVLAANKAMAAESLISVATEIYEQRLLVTGMVEDPAKYAAFKKAIADISGVRKLYWHVTQMSEAEQEAAGDKILSWSDALVLDTKVGLALVEDGDVADVNYRVAVDSFSNVYLIGRARSQAEHDRAVADARGVKGVAKVADYIDVRP